MPAAATDPPATDRVTLCALVATKITERYGLTDSERDCLLPSMRSWDADTLADSFCWEHDKLGLLGADPVFHDFRLIEDGSEISFRYKLLYLRPDSETLYCMVTNDVDSGALLVFEQEWYVMAAFGVYKLMDHLAGRGFSSWDTLEEHNNQHNSDSDVSDYWNQYGEQEQQIEESGAPQKTNINLFIQSHLKHSVRDLYPLYECSAQQFGARILEIVEGHAKPHDKLGAYTRNLLQNCFQLYQQVGFDEGRLVDDIKLVLLELDFMVLNRMGGSE